MKNRVEWEMFCDESYFDLWVVRPVGDKSFLSQRLFHFDSKSSAEKFKELLEISYHSVGR